jgi:drug/metabolite transporter (DMT)-like permease
MTAWFIIAIIGHLANGGAFIVDKALLSSAFKRSATYAGLVGILSFGTLILIPFAERWPTGLTLFVGLASGITFVLALWCFFAALARAEASRVVPIVGSLIPVLTLVGAAIFLGERLSQAQLGGFALLVIATAILSSGGGKAKPTGTTILFAVAAAVLFAVSSVTGKAIYDNVGFIGGLVTTRIAAGLMAIIIVTLLDHHAGDELMSMVRPKKDAPKKPRVLTYLTLAGQILGSVGFFLVQYGIAKGSASIVNALQAVQYAFLVLAAFALRKRAPKLMGESFERNAIIIKIVAIAITAAGLALVAS